MAENIYLHENGHNILMSGTGESMLQGICLLGFPAHDLGVKTNMHKGKNWKNTHCFHFCFTYVSQEEEINYFIIKVITFTLGKAFHFPKLFI